MAVAQEVIVYNSPLDKIIWDSILARSYGTPWVFMIICGIVVASLVIMAIDKWFPNLFAKMPFYTWQNKGTYQLVTWCLIVVGVVWYMYIP